MPTPADVNLTHKPLDALDPDTRAAARAAHKECIAQRHLPIWCVMFNPSDLPGMYVARLNIATYSGAAYVASLAVVGTTLDAVRQTLPAGLVRMPRLAGDEPQIVETWL